MVHAMNFGDAVRELRERKVGSQGALALAMGRSLSWVQKTEASAIPRMHLDNYIKLAGVLGLTREQLDAKWKEPADDDDVALIREILRRLAVITDDPRKMLLDFVAGAELDFRISSGGAAVPPSVVAQVTREGSRVEQIQATPAAKARKRSSRSTARPVKNH